MSRRRRELTSDEANRRADALVKSGSFESSSVRKALVALAAIKVAGLVALFDPASAQAFDGAKAAFSLAVAWLLLALIGLAALRYGTGIFVRTRLHVVVALYALANVLAAVFADDRYIAAFGGQRHVGLTFVLDMVVLYVAIALAYRTTKEWAALGVAVAGAGVVAIAYGFVQYAGLDPIPWAEFTRQRPPSTFGNPDKFGHFLAATVLAATGFAMVPDEGQTRRWRVLAGLYAIAAAGAVALIATRASLLGIALGLPALGLVYLRFAPVRPAARSVLTGVGVLVGAVVIAGALLMASPLGERVRSGFADVATQQRVFIADAAIRAFRDRPLTGHGPDNFGVIYPRYRPPSSVAASGLVNQDSAHSWLLQAAATTGAIGTLSLAAVIAASFLLLWRGTGVSPQVAAPLLAGAVGYWGAGLVGLGSPSVDWIGWVAAGGAATFGRHPVAPPPRRIARLVPAIVIGSAVLLIVWSSSAFQASRELNTARAARQIGRSERAIPAAERAVQLDPGRAEHWYALGQARQDRNMLAGAAEAYRAATDRAPYVSTYWSSLALALTNLVRGGDNSMGGRDVALAAARRSADADPYSPAPYHVLALIANSFGEHAAALDASTTAIRLSGGGAEFEAAAADAALRLPDSRAARAALERLIEHKDSTVLRVALVRISLKLNDTEAARLHLRRALEIDPQNASALELRSQIGVPPP